MALIASQSIVEDGLTVTLTAPGTVTNTFTNTGKEFILIENSSGGEVTVTVTTVVTSVENNQYGILAKANAVKGVAATSTGLIGTFPVTPYNGADSAVSFTLNTTTDVKVAILYIG